MPVLNQALAAQQPPQPGMQPQQLPQPVDPVAELMAEYQRLEASTAPAPTFTPEERGQRIKRNDRMTEVGLLGQLSGNKRLNAVGGQVFKQALGEGDERVTDRGVFNPLTGDENLAPEFKQQQAEARRGQILQRALAYQQAREGSQDRLTGQRERIAQSAENARLMAETRRAIAESKGGGEGRGHNLTVVKDEQTGKSYWADPRTGQTLSEVTAPNVGGQRGSALVRPDKMGGADESNFTKIVTSQAAVDSALAAVEQMPNAFSAVKGSADLVPGTPGTLARAARDRRLTPDEIAARAMVYNNVSAIIKDRAGLAQSTAELKRLNGFLPGDLDGPQQIKAKLKAFKEYQTEQANAMRAKYAGQRPMAHMGGEQVPAPAAPQERRGTPTRLKFNPATGDFE